MTVNYHLNFLFFGERQAQWTPPLSIVDNQRFPAFH
jgi:hypothetical protein